MGLYSLPDKLKSNGSPSGWQNCPKYSSKPSQWCYAGHCQSYHFKSDMVAIGQESEASVNKNGWQQLI